MIPVIILGLSFINWFFVSSSYWISDSEGTSITPGQNVPSSSETKYDLSEIVFQAKDQNDFMSKVNKIKLDIDLNGFSAAANKFSTSDSSKFGGKIGKVKENQLSKKIQQELNKISIGQITNPINIGNGFIILYVHDKKINKFEEDEKLILKKMIEFERAKQFSQFSRIYFNKIKINAEIKSD